MKNLTDEELDDLIYDVGALFAADKTCTPWQRATQQRVLEFLQRGDAKSAEPVAWLYDYKGLRTLQFVDELQPTRWDTREPLYATPPSAAQAPEVARIADKLRAWHELAEYANGGWNLPAEGTHKLNVITGQAAILLESLVRENAELRADMDSYKAELAALSGQVLKDAAPARTEARADEPTADPIFAALAYLVAWADDIANTHGISVAQRHVINTARKAIADRASSAPPEPQK